MLIFVWYKIETGEFVRNLKEKKEPQVFGRMDIHGNLEIACKLRPTEFRYNLGSGPGFVSSGA